MKSQIASLEAELEEYAEDTGREEAEREARRKRRGMHALTLIPAGLAGGAAAAREHPAMTAGITAVTASVIAGALALGIGGDGQPPPIAGPRPTVTVPAAQPSSPPASGRQDRREPMRPRPTPPPRVVVVPVAAPPPARPDRASPKAPPPATAPPSSPRDEQQPAEPSDVPPTCLADVRVITIRLALLCGQS